MDEVMTWSLLFFLCGLLIMAHYAHRFAQLIDDVTSTYFKWILMVFTFCVGFFVINGLRFIASLRMLYATLALFVIIEVIIYTFVARLPTAAEHKAFLDTYFRGPPCGKFNCPKVKKGSRIRQMARILDSVPAIRKDMIGGGIEAADVDKWAKRLETMAIKFV